ncbi:MAG: carboxypeptidase-like regulatory domain-containing protein [Thermoanaerobaculia bacterium]
MSSQNQAPISQARVNLWSSQGLRTSSTSTDATGAYSFGALSAGTYYLTTSASSLGFLDELYNDYPCPVGPPVGCDPLQGEPLRLEAGEQRTGVDFSLGPGGTIAGRLLDAGSSEPLAGQEVQAYGASLQFVASGTSDAAGRYRVRGLGSGNYFVRTRSYTHLDEVFDNLPCSKNGCDLAAGTNVLVTAGEVASGIDFRLDRLGTIAGTIHTADSRPPSLVRIETYDSTGRITKTGLVSPDGSYSLGGLDTGTYFVRAADSGGDLRDELYDDVPCDPSCSVTTGTPVHVERNATTAGIDFGLDVLGKIAGVIDDQITGLPIGNLPIRVLNSQGSWLYGGFADSLGHYLTRGLPTGSYQVRTGDPEFSTSYYQDELYDNLPCTPECPVAQGTTVAVELNSIALGIDFALQRAATLSGRVTDATTHEPIPELPLFLRTGSGEQAAYALTEPDGTYILSPLQPGTYYLATSSNLAYRNESFDNVPCAGECTVEGATPIAISLGEDRTDVDFALDRLGRILGLVSEEGSARPLGYVHLQAWDSSGKTVTTADTDSLGRYELSGLSPGTYRVTADSFLFGDELYDNIPCPGGPLSCALSVGAPILVSLNSIVSGIDFALQPLATIEGRVTDAATGLDLDQPIVTAWQLSGSATSVHGNNGRYSFTGLQPGTYYLTASAPSYTTQLYPELPCPGGPPAGCTLTSGTPLVVGTGSVTSGIDFALDFSGDGIVGLVRAQGSGEPLAGLPIDFWSPAGQHLGTVVSEANGGYLYAPYSAAGTYYLSTDLGPGDSNQVWNHLTCPGGSAFFGFCDPLRGTPVIVTAGGGPVTADFTLSVLPIFSDGFESGDLSSWSSVGP